MTLKLCIRFGFALLALACSSCKEHPDLVKKQKAQQQEIVELEKALAVLNQQMKPKPGDKSRQLEIAKIKLEKATVEATRFEKEVGDLEQKKSAAQKELEEYRKKHPISSL